MNKISNVKYLTKDDKVFLGTLIWIGDESSVYILGRMVGSGYMASLVSLNNGNLWHIDSAEVSRDCIPLSELKRIIGAGNDWAFIKGVTLTVD